ncbi:MAG: acyloxyacyl hydrolase [Natronospirillum sp.]|uniref:acyloxyacyl hydrolase n=1 Tax=Natronospirillum sp. TaxID=2812955 RepID=UPI0025ED451B|nr:acyloxyacyl hydrolase [Natronospirillum sp.]MCH8552651.1 acyloxyacyl hydrolase [Natronospirillum sp.]
MIGTRTALLSSLLSMGLLGAPAAAAEAATGGSDPAAYVQVFIGQVDVGRPQADSQYGVEWLPALRWTGFDLQPVAGLLRTRHGSHMVYGGIQRRTAFMRSGEGPALNVGLAPGLYLHGGNSDTDLGFPLQFMSSVGVDHQFPDGTRIGLWFSHISNASLSDDNPGTELLTLKYGLKF